MCHKHRLHLFMSVVVLIKQCHSEQSPLHIHLILKNY